MTGNAKIGAALVGGYLLGRTKKAKLAIGFGMFLAGKKLSLDPKQLGRMLADSPVLGSLNDQVRKELVGATRTAATNALTQRATGLADSLHKRTLELDDPSGAQSRDTREEDDADATEDEDRDARDDEGGADDEGAEEKPARRRTTAAKRTAKSTGGTAGGARKKAAPATRKAASGARRTTSSKSSGARRNGGGSNA
ncbi:hypothetical protein [Streptomyces mutomycini]|uniref:DNA primase n=1 Tax=Streptomyces mutomycini TaxID=284036 RepID=A0ABW0AZH2_9ACTN|nr:hypothetical protein [Streptomyces mutomycini]